MVKVVSKGSESIRGLLRRFKKACDHAGIVRDIKRTSVYEKPSDRIRRERVKRCRQMKQKLQEENQQQQQKKKKKKKQNQTQVY